MVVRAGLGLFVVAVLLQLVRYGRDHTNPPVTRDAPWSDGRARELATAACDETRVPLVAIPGGGEATPHRLCVIRADAPARCPCRSTLIHAPPTDPAGPQRLGVRRGG
jgi:hypothetical protein